MSDPAPAFAPAPRGEPAPAALDLRSDAQIASLLGRAQQGHTLLSVRAGGRAALFSSMLLLIDPRRQCLFLDEPYPPAPALLKPGTALTVGGRFASGHFEFDCVLAETVELDGAPAVRVSYPLLVSYYERRANYRLHIPNALALPPLQLTGRDHATAARIVDLSQFGAGALVDGGIDAPIGEQLACQLSLPGTTLRTAVEVRSAGSVLGLLRLGLMFARLTREQEGRIAQAIGTLQRQLIRTTAARG